MRKIRKALDKLIYNKCCETYSKQKFEPYEKAIDQTYNKILSLIAKNLGENEIGSEMNIVKQIRNDYRDEVKKRLGIK